MSIDQWWDTLLSLRKLLRIQKDLPPAIKIDTHSGQITFLPTDQNTRDNTRSLVIDTFVKADIPDAHIRIKQNMLVECLATDLDPSIVRFLQIYLPFCFAPFFAKKQGRPVTVAHFAQSLDGRIATQSGHSKWIGGDENLRHAHRMRAICDAVLIGKNTLKVDQPRLTVRHVSGENPVRIVLGDRDLDLSSLEDSADDPIWVLGKSGFSGKDTRAQFVKVDCTEKKMNSTAILQCLFDSDIYSIYIEGGPYTTSRFIADGEVDILQLHIAPLLFGSGMPCAVLPEIKEVGESVSFGHYDFHPIGKGVMFVGYPNKPS